MVASRDAAVLAALKQLEDVRERLHSALREAAFSFTTAQREEESTRGCFVSLDAVPTAQGTLEALVSLTQTSATTSTSGVEETRCGESDEAARIRSSSCAWEMLLVSGDRRKKQMPAAASQHAPPAPNCGSEASDLFPPDPIYYFSEYPSSALRECQEAYRRVLRCAVETVNAQQRALAEAVAMTMTDAQES